MKRTINRREFIRQSTALGVTAAVGSLSIPYLLDAQGSDPIPDLVVAHGTAYFENTMKAVDELGGIKSFVRQGSTVGLLINSPWDKRGTFTNPEIALAVIKMCTEAGAKDIYSIERADTSYWRRTKRSASFEAELLRIKTSGEKNAVKIDKGKSLKEAEISQALLACDVYINIPIIKNHEGTHFTGTLKNVMGACSSSTNRFFHQGSGKGGLLRRFRYYEDPEFLSQCIADVNLIRTPNLCIADATEFVTTNGPSGPGDLKKANKIIAGTNGVSVDAFGATLLGLTPAEILMIRFANEHGLGEMNLSKLHIKEI